MDWFLVEIVIGTVLGLIFLLFGYMVGWYAGKKKGKTETLEIFWDEINSGKR